jgi:NAD(P)-dependent dehydrogenase (short-subunit alcohol dehydrogenase family)
MSPDPARPGLKLSAVVTGAAGGIGFALCARLKADGYHVIGLDQNPVTGADEAIRVDLADHDAVARVGADLAERYEVAALVHNAAVQPLGGAGDIPIESWIEALAVNVVAVDVLVGALKTSIAAHEGAVVVISSVHGRATTSGITAYATTKAALEGWVRAAAMDLAPHIRVNGVAPGAIDTQKLREGFARWGEVGAMERRRVLEDRTPLQRIGAPEDVAHVVSFLCGPQSHFVTGSTIVADGGATIRLGSE